MDTGGLRYVHSPVLQSILAFGAETHVPDHDICRLSYYLKCCVVGCGIDMPLLDEALLDYMTAHTLPTHLQELIKRVAYRELSLEKLINSAFVLDEQHVLLPHGTLNTFFEFKTASTFFTINSFSIDSLRQVYVHKVMLCTFKWFQEYYIHPFIREQQGNTLRLPLVASSDTTQDLQPAIDFLGSLVLSLQALQQPQHCRQPTQHVARPPTEEELIASQFRDDEWQNGMTGPNLTENFASSHQGPQMNRGLFRTETSFLADVPMAVAVPIDNEYADSEALVEASAVIML